MVNKDAIRTVIGIVGNVISFGLFLSPLPTYTTIIKRKDVEQFSPNPYLATILNCAMWVFYGMPFVHPHSTLVITINGVGFVIEFIYISIYLKYSNAKQRSYVFKVLAGELIFMVVVILVTLMAFHTIEARTSVVGILCVVFNICMYAMPLDVMRLVIKTKSVEYLPFFLTLANFCNGLIWVAYAQIRFDLFITISNGSGAALGLIQLLLYAAYYKTTPKRDSKNVELSSNV